MLNVNRGLPIGGAVGSVLNWLGIDVAASIRKHFQANFDHLLGSERGIQEKLAAALGVSPGTVSLWRNGKRFPDGDNLEGIIKFLGIEPADLFMDPRRLAELAADPDKRRQQDALRQFDKAFAAVQSFAKSVGYKLVQDD